MLIHKLKTIVGDSGWTTDAAVLEPHLKEWRDIWTGETLIMVSPKSTDEVAGVVRACHRAGIAVVPQGGNTGLCGGAIPDRSGEQVLLSMSRLNKIRSISPKDHSIVVDAGCTLANIQSAAEDVDRFFPLSLAAEGSCQIGGNLSTNAGGINVLRYGTARAQALGLEVVLPDGTVWDGLRSLRKDTAGYDLKQLFIGAEGTLGVITGASLRLYPAVKHAQTALVSLQTPEQAVGLLAELRHQMFDQIQAFELISDRAIRYALRHIPETRFPLERNSPWYVLLEIANIENGELFEQALASCLDSELISDAVVAKNKAEASELWRLRHSISEAQKKEGASLKHDVSVPVGSVGSFMDAADAAVAIVLPGVRVVAFGHVGDGNIHYNLSQPKGSDPVEFLQNGDSLAAAVYDVVDRFGGSISAEHGIGQAKRGYLRQYRSDVEIGLMRTLKMALDPQNTMNPGKVI
jgi:FAD/FMN-containing dehydrogenase